MVISPCWGGEGGDALNSKLVRVAVGTLLPVIISVATVATVNVSPASAAQAVAARPATAAAQPAAAQPKALILGTSVTTPGPPPAPAGESLEQYEAEQDGFAVTSVTAAQWDAMTAAQFAAYR